MEASKTQMGGEAYIAPQVEMIEVEAEKGFADSSTFPSGEIEGL